MTRPERWLEPAGTARTRLEAPDPDAAALVEHARRFDLGEPELFVARELAALVPGLDGPARHGLTLLVLASLASQARGSTRLPIAGRDGPLDALLGELGADALEQRSVWAVLDRIRGAVERGDEDGFGLVAGGPGAYKPLVLDGAHLYHQRMWALEVRVAMRLAARLGAPLAMAAADRDRLVADVEAAPPLAPNGRPVVHSSAQRAAVRAALEGQLTVISGGPGTGKTSIVVSILRALARARRWSLDGIALAAPTGKAADRMRASIDRALRGLEAPTFDDGALLSSGPVPRTLHRLLGYSPRSGRFRHHEHNPLPEQFVIVDESSMIDLALMDRLLRALPDEAQLVLLGDAHQLPSVDAGAVFRDLSDPGGARTVHLHDSYRMDPSQPSGRNILTMAARIHARDGAGLFEPHAKSVGDPAERVTVRELPSEIAFDRVEWIDPGGARGREALLARWYQARVYGLEDLDALTGRTWRFGEGGLDPAQAPDLDRLFAHFERSRILCLTRRRGTGVEAVNAWFHARMLGQRRRGRTPRRQPALLAGEPVLVQRNDYGKGLFNGDPGLVLWASWHRDDTEPSASRLAAVFRRDEGFVAYPLEAVRSLLELAWAITVHKAQGSEYEHVAVVLPETETPLLTRELLYTAVTRSSSSVLLIGARSMLERGVFRALERFSGVAARLGESGYGARSPSGS